MDKKFRIILLALLFLAGVTGKIHQVSAIEDFDLESNIYVYSFAVQLDGKILAGGNFKSISGKGRNYIVRLDPDGAIDSAFSLDANNAVFSMAVQHDGRILVGGDFTSIGGQLREGIARLNSNGTLDETFNPDFNSYVTSIEVQPDDKILVGGIFTSVWGQTRNHIVRLNPDGALDTTFDPNPDNNVYSIVVQPDGKILTGGGFTSIGGQSRDRIARLNSDGTLDMTFNPHWEISVDSSNIEGNFVISIAVQQNGKILAGRSLTGIERKEINHIVRFNSDGTADTTFNLDNNNSYDGHLISVQPDGKILACGTFKGIGSAGESYVARLNTDGTIDMTFNPYTDNHAFSIAVRRLREKN
ncbi:MAG: delta-60 repeat domain-containing protein [bacterium]|nr:delta-60 repeat domain-containing protein [bacterium]